ncbi:MFS transporter [Magnetospirillum sp. SS-4]|uniref:MFS transporter n=1 Tax=Magnetospirillum sp. SS-4 TaxID=2681465 RepID=UPI001386105C|nr:MFS transporter [Magnetospirillum sp. SS-4]CAA7622054.1 Permease of the major facilitator superfamily [Magnetospirillum sp. SS-4]
MTEPARTSWPATILAVGAGIVAAFQVGKAPIALPFIRDEIGLSLTQASWILSIFALLGATAGAAAGSIVTRMGARPMLPAGLIILAAASLAGAFATDLASLLVSRAIEGIGFMLVVISAPALITLLTRTADRQTAFGLWGSFMPFGVALSMTAAPLLPMIGWRGLWGGMAVLLALYAVLIHRRMPKPPPPPASEDDHPLRDIAATITAPGPLVLAGIFIPYSAAYAVLAGFLPTLLIERMDVSPGTAGLMTALAAAFNIIGNIATGPLLRLGASRWAILAAAGLTVAVVLAGIFAPGTPVLLAYGLCMVFFTVGGLVPGCLLGGASIYTADRRLVPVTLGLLMQGSNLGLLLGPVAVGAAVAATGGWWAAAAVLVPAALAGLGLVLVLRRMGKES